MYLGLDNYNVRTRGGFQHLGSANWEDMALLRDSRCATQAYVGPRRISRWADSENKKRYGRAARFEVCHQCVRRANTTYYVGPTQSEKCCGRGTYMFPGHTGTHDLTGKNGNNKALAGTALWSLQLSKSA